MKRRILTAFLAAAAIHAGAATAAAQTAGAANPETFSSAVLMLITGIAAMAAAAALCFAFWRQRETLLLGRLMDALPIARIVIDGDGKVLVASRKWRELFRDEKASLEELIDHARSGGTGEAVDRLIAAASRREERYENVILDLPAMKYARISVIPVDSRRNLTIWNVVDASELFTQEEIIRREQQKLIEFVENAPIGFYSVDGQGRFLFANATFAEWIGVSDEDLLSRKYRLRDFVQPDIAETMVAYSPLPGGDGDALGDAVFRTRSGQDFDAYLTQTVVVDGETGALHTRSLVRHLSAERSHAEEVRISQDRFRRFFVDAPVGIALIDSTGRISECNDALGETTGQNGKAMLGVNFVDLITPSERDAFEDWVRTVYRDDESVGPFDTSFRDEDPVAVSLFASLPDAQKPDDKDIIIHVFDISEKRKIEAQFFQSQKMELVGQLAGGIAHDFNNLLTAMIGFCDLLLLRHTPRDQSFADIQQIKQNANRAANLVRQLLAFSRQQTLQPKVLDLTEVLSETSYLLRRLIGARIELKFHHGRDLWQTWADQGQLEQVVINLAVNARDAMPVGGTLTIRTANVFAGDPRLRDYDGIPDGDYVLLEMQDTGTGIPPEIVGKIFEPFFTTKEVGAGTGLSLSTVYGIVKQTGGYVFVDTEPDKGARFSVYLPRYREEEEPAAVAPAAAEDDAAQDLTGIGTVLLVEDEDAVRLFGARALRNKGYNVIEAKDGEGALDILNGVGESSLGANQIDLLVTDVVMPGVDGPSLVRQVRETRPELKVIYISGYTEDTFRQRLGEGEKVEFLSKPFTLQQLAGKVKEVMDA